MNTELHSTMLEQSVLVALMTIENSIDKINGLHTEHFFADRHQHIFNAIMNLAKQGKAYDVVMVKTYLEQQNLLHLVGGEEYLLQMMADTPISGYHLETYSDKIKELAVRRELERQAEKIKQQAKLFDGNVSDLIQQSQNAIANITTESKGNLANISHALSQTFSFMDEKLKRLQQGGNLINGIQTGIVELDNLLGDVEAGHLMVIAGRPAMGKTTMLQTIASHVVARQHKPVLVMSGEMPLDQIAMRFACAFASVDYKTARNRPDLLSQDDWNNYTQAVTKLSNAPLMIDDTPNPSLGLIRDCARKTKAQYGSLGLIMVDYLQIMSAPKAERRDLEIAELTKGLKAMAKEFKCPVVVLAQLSRDVEKRANKRPMMSDLRESGAIEQDADQVVFLYRDEVYNSESKYKGMAEAILAKNRHGETGTAMMYADLKYCQFSNLDQEALMAIHGERA